LKDFSPMADPVGFSSPVDTREKIKLDF
jgi:hypothetical protein